MTLHTIYRMTFVLDPSIEWEEEDKHRVYIGETDDMAQRMNVHRSSIFVHSDKKHLHLQKIFDRMGLVLTDEKGVRYVSEEDFHAVVKFERRLEKPMNSKEAREIEQEYMRKEDPYKILNSNLGGSRSKALIKAQERYYEYNTNYINARNNTKQRYERLTALFGNPNPYSELKRVIDGFAEGEHNLFSFRLSTIPLWKFFNSEEAMRELNDEYYSIKPLYDRGRLVGFKYHPDVICADEFHIISCYEKEHDCTICCTLE